MSPVTPLITVPGREVLISVILKQVCKLFCRSHRYDSDRVEQQPTRCKAPFAVNSPEKGKFPSGGGGGDIVIIEGERLKEDGRRRERERGDGVCVVALEMFSQPDCINICVPLRRLSLYV